MLRQGIVLLVLCSPVVVLILEKMLEECGGADTVHTRNDKWED